MGIDPNGFSDLLTRARIALAVLSGVKASKETILAQYLAIGEFQAVARMRFRSKVEFGRYIARQLPESSTFDSALRSDCTWLCQANSEPSSDLIEVLNHRQQRLGRKSISTILQYARYASHPSAIHRHYKTEWRRMNKAKAPKDNVPWRGADSSVSPGSMAPHVVHGHHPGENRSRLDRVAG